MNPAARCAGFCRDGNARSMNASHHPTTAPPLAKAGVSGAASPQRLLRLGAGLFVTFCPLAVWGLLNLALGSAFVEKNSWRLHLEPVQIRIWLLIAAGLFELIAVFVLRKTDQKPRDLIAILSLVDTGLSILLAVFFWAQISLLIFGAT
jgi:hypothetical protein